jgi:hypothetical protein
MEKAGQPLPEEVREPRPQGKGIDHIVETLAKNFAESHEDIVASVFGGKAEKHT